MHNVTFLNYLIVRVFKEVIVVDYMQRRGYDETISYKKISNLRAKKWPAKVCKQTTFKNFI